MPSNTFAVALAILLAIAGPAYSQITLVEGTAIVDRDRIHTAAGRVEVVTPDGALVHLDAATTIQINRAALQLLDGRVVVRSAATATRVQLPVADLTLLPYGVYSLMVDAESGRLLVKVAQGAADLRTRYGSTIAIGPRELAMMTSATSLPWAAPYGPAGWDGFEEWSDRRSAALTAMAAADDRTTTTPDVGTYAPSPCSTHGLPGRCRSLTGRAGSHGRRSQRATRPTYAPNYRPNYAPSYRPGSPSGPSHLPGTGARRLPPPPSPIVAPPSSPPTSAPPARGLSGSIRVRPERPESR